MKKIFFIAALPALAIILTGCFKKPAPLPTPTDNQPMQETPLNEAPAVIGTAYDINLEKSTIAWTGRKTMVKSEHFGKVNIKTGQILLDGTQLTGGNFTVDMPTIISEDAKGKSKEALETHIKGPDFLM